MNGYEEELSEIEKKIDELHEKRLANPDGMLWREAMELSREWLEFLEKGEDLLKLPPDKRSHFEKLARELLQGELNDPGREDDLREMARFRLLYRDAKEKQSPSQQP